jgi:hypothetical protein
MEQWISKEALLWISGAVAFVGVVGVPWMMVKMPADSFSKMEHQNWLEKQPAAIRVPLRILKNVLAFGLIVLGAIMFVAPGPGIFPVVTGILLADFPGKLKLQRWLLCQPKVMNSMNWLRQKFQRPPFQMPCAEGSR